MARKQPKSANVAPTFNVANDGGQALAPWPQTDRYPTLLGSNLTLAYIANVQRQCLNGYRQQFVDALDEMLDKDPHALATLGQRISAVSGADVEIVAAATDKRNEEQHGKKEADRATAEAERAEFIRCDVEKRFRAIPCLSTALQKLLWALYFGATAAEIHWDRREDGWWVRDLGMIHSRRIAYPDQTTWDMHIWDQGQVMPGFFGAFPTEQLFGLRPIDYPGKFITFDPSYRGGYPTREGIGRVIMWWMGIKSMAVRGASAYVERFAKPFVIGTFNTIARGETNPRAATAADIAVLDQATRSLGVGSLNAATLPDSVKVELAGPGVKGSTGGIDHEKLIALCDAQTSKAVRGSTLTTDTGVNGNQNLGQVHAEADVRNARYDADQLQGALQRDLIDWIVRLNYPNEQHLAPRIEIHVEKLDPAALIERAIKLAGAGAPVDARWLADKTGVKLVDPKDDNALRMAPVKPVDVFALEGAKIGDLRSVIEAMAGIAGMHLTPGMLDTVAALPPESAAQIVQELLAQAKASATAGVKPPNASGGAPDVNDTTAGGENPPAKNDNAPAEELAPPDPEE